MAQRFDHGGMLRVRDGGEQKVTPLELFFDLVYVFAITQLSHLLLNHPTIGGRFRHSSCCSWCGGRGSIRPGSPTGSTQTRCRLRCACGRDQHRSSGSPHHGTPVLSFQRMPFTTLR